MELGRIIKSIQVLDDLDDADKRRRILTQLDRQELCHRLARRVRHGNRGELVAGYREGREETLGAFDLVLDVIALWNATTIQAAVARLEAEGHRLDPADLARASPPPHRHITVLGRYSLTVPNTVADGELRPLREPASEQDFRTASCQHSAPLARMVHHQAAEADARAADQAPEP